MKKTILSATAIAMLFLTSCCNNNPAPTADEDSTTYDEVVAKLDSTNAGQGNVEVEQWQDGGELQWDD